MALSNLIVQSAISLNYTAKDSSDVIHHLGQKLVEAGLVNETFVEAALEREKTMPTGLPLAGSFNAAIPHTDIEHVKASGVAIATLSSPVKFRNMVIPDEAVEVNIVFLLALDQAKTQIVMLQEVAGVLQNSELIESLMAAKEPLEIIEILGKASKE